MNQMQHDLPASPVERDYGSVIGTPFKVFLSNGVTETRDETTGKAVTEIVDLPGLIAAILRSRVLRPRKLTGDDLKYIRSALRMRSAQVAEVLELSPEHYSRCEAGTKSLSSSTEKSYRMYVFLEAAKHMADQQQNVDCSPEEAREMIDAFRNVFQKMKIESIFDVTDKLVFSFSRRACPDEADGRWQSELQAA